MKDKVCIVTGSNSGIGKVTALELVRMGARVVMAVRNKDKGEAAKMEIAGKVPNALVDVMVCDLSSMDSIRKFSEEFKEKYNRLDVLVNNAGAFFSKRGVTADGFENNLVVNYLGQVLLIHELLPQLKSSAPSRIVNVSSGLQRMGKLDFSDLQMEKGYSKTKAYANTKLMMVMFTYSLARLLDGSGVTVNVLHPGFVATEIGSNSGDVMSKITFKLMRPFQLSAKRGAATSIYLASSHEVEGVNGKFYSVMEEKRSIDISYDEYLQKQLWDRTMEMLKVDSKFNS
jgi:NAD(P)-dependent dehydrogenase (short-subunit alcohol dehydrogenase family)